MPDADEQQLRAFYGNDWYPAQVLRGHSTILFDLHSTIDYIKSLVPIYHSPYPRIPSKRSIEETPWLYPQEQCKPFIPDPYLQGENWTTDPIPRYIGPITPQMEAERVYGRSWDRSPVFEKKVKSYAPFQLPPDPLYPEEPAMQPQHDFFFSHPLPSSATQPTLPRSITRRSITPQIIIPQSIPLHLPQPPTTFANLKPEQLERALMDRNLSLAGSRQDQINRLVGHKIQHAVETQGSGIPFPSSGSYFSGVRGAGFGEERITMKPPTKSKKVRIRSEDEGDREWGARPRRTRKS